MAPLESLEPREHRLEAAAPFVAEFVGTFMLVFTVGVCCIAGDPVWNFTAIGAMLMVMIYGLGPISGGHFNPAVSLACVITGKMPVVKAAGYVLVQVFAGLLAGWVYWGTFGQAAAVGPKASYTWFHVGVAELVYTAMLAFAHLNCATSARNNPQGDQNCFFGLGIGFVLVAGGYAAGEISGASFNPAVTLGLDVTGSGGTGKSGGFWRVAYVLYELLGAGLAAILFRLCRLSEVSGTSAGFERGAYLQIKIEAAHNLTNNEFGMSGVSDPYVSASLGIEMHRTPTINNNLNPVWTTDNVFTFDLVSSPDQPASQVLTLEVANDNTVFKDQSMGTLTLDVSGLREGQWHHVRQKLEGSRSGELEVSLLRLSSGSLTQPSLFSQTVSEGVGTFMLAFTVGLNVISKSPATAFSAAAALMSMIYSLGNVSGGHFNPAVTVAVVLSGRGVCAPVQGLVYVLVQLAAGVLAGLLFEDFHYAGPYRNEFFGLAPGASVQVLGETYTWWTVFWAELAFTGMIAFVVLAVATTKPQQALSKQNFPFALAIGSCVTAGGFAIGAISGGELNPAVSWALATASSVHPKSGRLAAPWTYCLSFSIFELAGGFVAAGLFHLTHRTEYVK
eukprot:CAMPEP_0171071676 /NCGR_PEP_ID=MMETSP0766_2-20121228/10447_1 /TAXON_ID=439317 /ORGANISM="Gambierdiscus australes, Strain CAWD 149" /LENGTH=617 /DNA_ID=CAMNT_0011528225 /DNA_START=70 /DNA_END=1923 /DNA_ORIENTATION=+